MTQPVARPAPPSPLAERFWSIARGMEADPAADDPQAVVRHVLAILDKLHRGEQGAPVSVATLSFLKMLRESEQNGDLSYAAPEQICGEILDERALVFSVGVLLFERLTGRHPFGADKQRRIARIRKGEFGSGVNYFPTVPTPLRTILMKAMGPFAEERWSTLAELRWHLEQFTADERPYLPGTSSPRPTRKRTEAPRVASGTIDRPPQPPPPTPQPLYTLPDSIDLKPRRDRLRPLMWAGIGAAIASIVLFLTRNTDSTPPPSPSPAIATAEPIAQPPPPPPPTPTPSPALTPPPPTPPPLHPSTPAAFDAQSTGDRAAALARSCIAPSDLSRGLAFGLSLLLDESSGRVKTIYFATPNPLPAPVRRCITQTLITRPIATAPAPRAIVSYYLQLRGDTTHVRRTGKH